MGIGNEFTVCSSSGYCVGVSRGGGEGELIVTFKSGAILVYNIHDFSMVCSWQLSSSDQLLCAAITQPHTGTYWGIASRQGMLEWSREDDVITPSLSAIDSNPSKLLVSELNRNPLVVYCNGSVGFVDGTSRLLAPKKGAGWLLHMAEVSCSGKVCVVGVQKDVTIGIAETKAGTVGMPCLTSIKSRGEHLVSGVLCADRLLLLFSEGELLMVTLEPPLHPILSGPAFPPPYCTCLLAPSSDYILLANADSLQLWDTYYYTCQDSVQAHIPADAKACCVENSMYVWNRDGGGAVRGWGIEVGRSKLSAALGKSSSSRHPKVLLSWPLSPKDIEAEESAESASDHDYLHSLCSKNETPNLETFMSVFNSQPLTPDRCYIDVIGRLLSEEEFWGHEPLSAFLEAGLVPSNVDVLGEASARGDWSLAESALTHCTSPQEQSIAATLQKVLSLPEVLQGVDGGAMPKKQLLYKLLCQPFNDVLMQAPLAALPFPVVKELLSFLSGYVGVASLLTTPPDLSYNMVLEWISLILDVHFTRLTLDHESRQLLLSLQSKVLAQVTCYNRISSLSSLEQVHCNWKRHNSDRWLYRVESWQLKM